MIQRNDRHTGVSEVVGGKPARQGRFGHPRRVAGWRLRAAAVLAALLTGAFLVPFDAAAQGWSPPWLVSDALPISADPALAVTPDGTLHAVWEDDFLGSPRIIYASKPVGGDWSIPLTDISGVTTGTPGRPDIAATPNGAVHVLWHVDAGGGSFDVWYATKPAGGSWSTPVQITTGGESADPSLVAGSDGSLHALTTFFAAGVRYLRKPVGGSWTPEKTFLPVSGSAIGLPSLAIGSGGSLYGVWLEFRSPNWSVVFVEKPAGGVWGAQVTLADAVDVACPPEPVGCGPKIAVSPAGSPDAGRLHVVWQELVGSQRDIFYRTRPPGTTTWGARANISLTDLDDSIDPSVAAGGDGSIHVVWQEGSGARGGQGTGVRLRWLLSEAIHRPQRHP